MAMEITKENYEKEIASVEGSALIDFWAPWCAPCRMLAPVIEELSDELKGLVKVCKVNIDEQPELASQFGVMSIPTLVVTRNGQIITRTVGVQPKATILKMLHE